MSLINNHHILMPLDPKRLATLLFALSHEPRTVTLATEITEVRSQPTADRAMIDIMVMTRDERLAIGELNADEDLPLRPSITGERELFGIDEHWREEIRVVFRKKTSRSIPVVLSLIAGSDTKTLPQRHQLSEVVCVVIG
jgi:hypothetical protein